MSFNPLAKVGGASYLAKTERSNTGCVVYSACLSGRGYLAKSERSNTLILFTPLVEVGGAICFKA